MAPSIVAAAVYISPANVFARYIVFISAADLVEEALLLAISDQLAEYLKTTRIAAPCAAANYDII
jgi:hypothetical protein